MANSNNITLDQAVAELISRDHFVTPGKAANMINKMRVNPKRVFKIRRAFTALPFNSPEMPICVAYNRQAIEGLLNLANCIGIRIYPALNEKNQFTLVLTGIDYDGYNITPESGGNMLMSASSKFLDEGQMSPPYPSPSSL